MSQLKKLYLYQYESREIIVDSFVAKEWDDFLIIRVTASDPEIVLRMQPMLERLNQEMNKQIIIIDQSANIEFYGVEPEEDDGR